MSIIKLPQEDTFFQKLDEHLRCEYDENAAMPLMALAHNIFDLFPFEEWIEQGVRFNDVVGLVKQFQRLLSTPDQTFVRVFNPTKEEDGWVSEHTNIFVVHRNIPFLMDAILVALDRLNSNIQTAKSCVFGLVNDETGKLSVRADYSDDGDTAIEQVVVFLQIDRSESIEQCEHIEKQLKELVEELEWVSNDAEAIMRQLNVCSSQCPILRGGSPEEQIKYKSLLEWLECHFTFLGYSHTCVDIDENASTLTTRQDSFYGVLKRSSNTAVVAEQEEGITDYYHNEQDFLFTKSVWHSRIRKATFADEIRVKHRDSHGRTIGIHRFVGVYSAGSESINPFDIPFIRDKAQWIIEQSGIKPFSYADKSLRGVIEHYPIDEFFNTCKEELFETIIGIWQIHNRRKTKCFVHFSPLNDVVTCQVFIPKEKYTKSAAKNIEHILTRAFDARQCQWKADFSQSVLAQLQFTLLTNNQRACSKTVKLLEHQLAEAVRDWSDALVDEAQKLWGVSEGKDRAQSYLSIFPDSYKNQYSAAVAVKDIALIEALQDKTTPGGDDIAMDFVRRCTQGSTVELRLLHPQHQLELSDIVPILENLGFQVSGEHIYPLTIEVGTFVWLHVITLKTPELNDVKLSSLDDNIKNAFTAIWQSRVENDAFNQLIMTGGLHWRYVSMLRLYARYLKQLQLPCSQKFIAQTLQNNVELTQQLVKLFDLRFDPTLQSATSADEQTALKQSIVSQLDQVKSLNEDQVLRSYMEVVLATLRTNFFQKNSDGQYKQAIAIKLAPQRISFAPQPKPLYEVFVSGVRFEGVHLRTGKVARGGIRWSDRVEDYRTEILGLVKAQQIKNAVIVPAGAKGGFIAKKMSSCLSRAKQLAEGIACYQAFISALLDITDNSLGDEVLCPNNVVAHDDCDPYLVVAADKGTATFSDYANDISQHYDFWLRDAFASGGSNGYDHKQMGITARGAWVSVQRHFRELGVNTQAEDFTVVGIGDMAGDVFGNGMLLSKHIRLVAALNHQHIFIDPEPDASTSFNERQRLFSLPRSSWADYDKSIISAGGGIFSRSEKSIKLNSHIRRRFSIQAEQLPPNELISYLLRAQVDLIWNGGIGTYVKSTDEHHSDVGDRANDALRINADQLRCKVFGEGGNLGITQLGRVEFSLNGGACNTDSVDNAGGVDCSDHEVNIKILLSDVVSQGMLTEQQRNELLAAMTAQVAELVLDNNYQQTHAISLAHYQNQRYFQEYIRCISNWEKQGRLSRDLEKLPDDDTLLERQNAALGLTRPELSVLISYAKIALKEALLDSDLIEQEYFERWLCSAFPTQLVSEYHQQLCQHPLKREIIANQLANEVVNRMGLTFCYRQQESTGASVSEVVQSVMVVSDVLNLTQAWLDISQLDYRVPASEQMALFTQLMRLTRHCSRWLLRNQTCNGPAQQMVEAYRYPMQQLQTIVPGFYSDEKQADRQANADKLLALGISDPTARLLSCADDLYFCFGAASIAIETGVSLQAVAESYFKSGVALQLDWLSEQVVNLPVDNRWDDFAHEAFVDELELRRRELTRTFLHDGDCAPQLSIDNKLERWANQHHSATVRWHALVEDVKSTADKTSSMVFTLLSELTRLAALEA